MALSWFRRLFAPSRRTRPSITRRTRLELTALESRLAPAALYNLQWLGTVSPTDNFSSAQGINDKGQVVGDSWLQDSSGIPSQEKAFSWAPGSSPVSLGTLNGNASYAWAVNNNGVITGKYHYPVSSPGTTAGGGYYEWAFVDSNGTPSPIPGLASIGMMSVAYGLNDNNVVVGNADVPNSAGQSEAFTFDGKTVHFLGTLGGKWSYGMDINNAGVVAGFADTGQNPTTQPGVYVSRYHAVLWSPAGVIQDLGTFGTDSYAYRVNDAGQAVGSSIGSDGFYHPFLWDGTRMIDIVGLGGNGEALSINNKGQVVGDSGNWLGSTAFLYENGSVIDLNTLVAPLALQPGDRLMRANDINNLGQIVGYGSHNGRFEAYVLTPTTLTQALPTLTVSGGTFVYDGTTHAASATAVGSDGVTPVAGTFTFTYNGSTTQPSAAGSYAVLASFTSSDPGYLGASGTATITISPATPVFGNLASPTITAGAATTTLSGQLAAGAVVPSGASVSITLAGVTQTAVVDALGNFSSTFATGALAAGRAAVG